MKKRSMLLSLTILLAGAAALPAQDEGETATPLQAEMVGEGKEKAEESVLLPDEHGLPLPEREITPPEEADYWAYWIPGVKKIDGCLNKVSDVVPFECGGKLDIMSDWIDEGFNAGPHHLNLQQTYWGSYGGITVEYWQEDYFKKPRKYEWDEEEEEWVITDERKHYHRTLERDLTISYEFTILDRIIMEPMWTYINLPGYEDSQELGCALELDIPLHPAVEWSWDYKEDPHHDGMYFEFSLSQPIDISPGGRRLFTFTPSLSMGMNANKYIEDTILTHLNYGLEWEVPIGEHLSVFAYLNYLQGLNHRYGYVDQYPWGGMGVQMKF